MTTFKPLSARGIRTKQIPRVFKPQAQNYQQIHSRYYAPVEHRLVRLPGAKPASSTPWKALDLALPASGAGTPAPAGPSPVQLAGMGTPLSAPLSAPKAPPSISAGQIIPRKEADPNYRPQATQPTPPPAPKAAPPSTYRVFRRVEEVTPGKKPSAPAGEAASESPAPEKHSSPIHAPESVAPVKVSRPTAAPSSSVQREVEPGRAAPATPEHKASEGGIPEGRIPEGKSPEETISEGNIPERKTPEGGPPPMFGPAKNARPRPEMPPSRPPVQPHTPPPASESPAPKAAPAVVQRQVEPAPSLAKPTPQAELPALEKPENEQPAPQEAARPLSAARPRRMDARPAAARRTEEKPLIRRPVLQARPKVSVEPGPAVQREIEPPAVVQREPEAAPQAALPTPAEAVESPQRMEARKPSRPAQEVKAESPISTVQRIPEPDEKQAPAAPVRSEQERSSAAANQPVSVREPANQQPVLPAVKPALRQMAARVPRAASLGQSVQRQMDPLALPVQREPMQKGPATPVLPQRKRPLAPLMPAESTPLAEALPLQPGPVEPKTAVQPAPVSLVRRRPMKARPSMHVVQREIEPAAYQLQRPAGNARGKSMRLTPRPLVRPLSHPSGKKNELPMPETPAKSAATLPLPLAQTVLDAPRPAETRPDTGPEVQPNRSKGPFEKMAMPVVQTPQVHPTTSVVQREVEEPQEVLTHSQAQSAPPSNAQVASHTESMQPAAPAEVDLDQVAKDVYPLLLRRLMIEKERHAGRKG